MSIFVLCICIIGEDGSSLSESAESPVDLRDTPPLHLYAYPPVTENPPIDQLQMSGFTPGLPLGYAPRSAPGYAPFKLPSTRPNLTFERQLLTVYSSPSPPVNSEGTDQNQVPTLQNGN